METVVPETKPHKAVYQKNCAFYYAAVVLIKACTGEFSTPRTVCGKLITMWFIIIGILLFLLAFLIVEELMNKFLSVVIRRVKTLLNCRNVQASELNLTCVLTTLSCLIIAGGAAVFSIYEEWSYFDSIFHCFIILTTIGFGDGLKVPKKLQQEKHMVFNLIVNLVCLIFLISTIKLTVKMMLEYIIAHKDCSKLNAICVVTTLSCVTMAGGAAVFSIYEGWSYFESFLYCFIILTTIGFADKEFALQKDNALNEKLEYVIFTQIFFVVGLVITGSKLNLVMKLITKLMLKFKLYSSEDERRDEEAL